MHTLIEDIIANSRSRGFGGPVRWGEGESRDLIKSARAVRSRGIPVIAEIKPKAIGRPLEPFEVEAYARAYEENGACAISVLTEPSHFLGSLDNARIARASTSLPVLRKDFIFDERQLSEVRADLVLLIAALDIDLDGLVRATRALGMEPLVEVHSEEEIKRALSSDARIIGINNRDLRSLNVDLRTFERLAPLAKGAGVFLIAESGVHSRSDAERMTLAGADALLVGSELMEKPERLADLNGMSSWGWNMRI